MGSRKLCKEFYGPLYEKMKRRHARIRKQIYREENGIQNELQNQKEKYNSDPILQKKKQELYKKRKAEDKELELKEQKVSFRNNAIKSVNWAEERLRNSNPLNSSKRQWIIKCFEHFFSTHNKVHEQTKEKLDGLIDSIKQKHSQINEKIDIVVKKTKDQIESANSDGLTPLEFQKVLSKFNIFQHFEGESTIRNTWAKFHQSFEVRLEDILKQVEVPCQDTEWYRSLAKISVMYKEGLKSYRTIDYLCLQKKLCIVCNQKSHHIDFDEELAKLKPNHYTYHGDSTFEKSEFMKF